MSTALSQGGIKAVGERVLSAIFSLGFFVLLWELAWYIGIADPRLMPPPHIFLGEFLEQAQYFSPRHQWGIGEGSEGKGSHLLMVVYTTLSTIARVLAGVVLATIISIALGLAIKRFVVVEKLFLPTVLFLAPVSPIAWLPVAIFIFGIGNPPAIFMVFIALFFIMTIATISEVDKVDRNLINASKVMGATTGQIYRYVIIPAIMPGMFVVLRLNLFAAWMVVLLAEVTGVGSGLGQIIMLARNTFNPALVFFTIAVIGLTGYLLDLGVRLVQNKLIYWA